MRRHNKLRKVPGPAVLTSIELGNWAARSNCLVGAVDGYLQAPILSFTWTDLGLPSSVTYPQISGIGPARTVSDTYTNT